MNPLNITILCTDTRHPVNEWLRRWQSEMAPRANVEILRDAAAAQGGDYLFLVSCHQIVGQAVRSLYRHTLVLHASALPQGRGMSPHIWQLLEGRNRITLSLLNAGDAVDTGDIWQQIELQIPPTALHDEINHLLFDAELALMRWAVAHCDHATPRAQVGSPSYYRKRIPSDSEIDPGRPLAESFDLLRIADPERYPAYFVHRGQKYRIRIDKL